MAGAPELPAFRLDDSVVHPLQMHVFMRQFKFWPPLALASLSAFAMGCDEAAEARLNRGGPGYHGDESGHGEDMRLFHFLLENRAAITREVHQVRGGIESVTESTDPAVAVKLREHVTAMHARLKQRRPIHARDPLFAEIFRSTDQIAMEITPTARGVKVRETSSDAYVARLISAHAAVVDAFLARGRTEMHRDHPLPPRD